MSEPRILTPEQVDEIERRLTAELDDLDHVVEVGRIVRALHAAWAERDELEAEVARLRDLLRRNGIDEV